MSIVVQDELLESLAELRRELPTMRLGQLIANMATVARGAVPGAVSREAEDDELLKAVRWQLRQLSTRTEATMPNRSSRTGETNVNYRDTLRGTHAARG